MPLRPRARDRPRPSQGKPRRRQDPPPRHRLSASRQQALLSRFRSSRFRQIAFQSAPRSPSSREKQRALPVSSRIAREAPWPQDPRQSAPRHPFQRMHRSLSSASSQSSDSPPPPCPSAGSRHKCHPAANRQAYRSSSTRFGKFLRRNTSGNSVICALPIRRFHSFPFSDNPSRQP